jgi:hypothetical protein
MSTTRLPEIPPMKIRRHFVHCAVFDPTPEHCDCGSLPKAYDADDIHAYGLAVWKAAMQHAAGLAKQMKPAGGRAWSEAQAAVFLALDDLEIALAALPLPEQGGPQ